MSSSLLLKEDKIALCLEECSRCGGQSMRKCESHGIFVIEELEFEHVCVWRRAERAGRTVSKSAVVQKDKRGQNLRLRCNTIRQFCCSCWSLLYSAILRFRADSLRSHVILNE